LSSILSCKYESIKDEHMPSKANVCFISSSNCPANIFIVGKEPAVSYSIDNAT
jgi:hypothetical protein